MATTLSRRYVLGLLPVGAVALLTACGGAAPSPTAAPTKPTEPAKPVEPTKPAAAPAATTAPAPAPTTAPAAATTVPAAPAATSAPAAQATPAPAAPAAENPFGTAQKTGGTYIVVVGSGPAYPQIFRGQTYYGSLAFWCCKMLYSTLVTLDRNWEKMGPGLATEWAWSADQKQLTMKLRRGVKFHDGRELTARDVEFTFKLLVRKENFPAVQDVTIFEGGKDYKERKSEKLAGVEAVDDYTVRFTLVSPSAVFLLNLSNTGILPMHGFPADALTNDEDNDKLKFFVEKPFGTGPFKIKSFDLNSNITFEAHKEYWKGAPKLDSIVFRVNVASPAMISGLESGQFDGAYIGLMQDAAALRDRPNLNIITNYSLANEQIFINSTEKAHLNVKVRQALITAIDVETLAKTVGYGFPKPAPSVIMSSYLFPNPKLPRYDFSVDKAKALLKEGNWDPNRKLVFGQGTKEGAPNNVYAAIINMWKAAGVEVEWKPFDPANNTKTWSANPHEYDTYMTSFAWLAYDPTSAYQSFRCPVPDKPSYTQYCNNRFDELMLQAIRTSELTRATPLLQEIQAILQTDLPYTPIWIEPEIWAITKKMHGGNLARGPLNDILAELWWKE